MALGVSPRAKAGDERIELPLKVLETSVIPLDQSPVLLAIYPPNDIITQFLLRLQALFKIKFLLHLQPFLHTEMLFLLCALLPFQRLLVVHRL